MDRREKSTHSWQQTMKREEKGSAQKCSGIYEQEINEGRKREKKRKTNEKDMKIYQ